MPIKICSFCGNIIQEGENHKLEDHLKTVDDPEMRSTIDQKIRNLAVSQNCDINSICIDCFTDKKAESLLNYLTMRNSIEE